MLPQVVTVLVCWLWTGRGGAHQGRGVRRTPSDDGTIHNVLAIEALIRPAQSLKGRPGQCPASAPPGPGADKLAPIPTLALAGVSIQAAQLQTAR